MIIVSRTTAPCLKRIALTSSLAVLAVAISTEAAAQDRPSSPDSQAASRPAKPADEPATGLQDIVVTAQKREQSLQTVGISMTAIGGDTLKSLGTRESVDIIAQVPNVQNESVFGPGANVNISIRGVSLNDYNDGTEAPVAVYLDEVYLVPLGAGSFPTYDLDRVEVLRGPQGTLFGRNTTGGILHYITNRPDLSHAYGSADLEYGRYNTKDATGVLNLPLSDSFGIRVSGNYHKNDGWMKNLAGQADAGVIDTRSARVQARYQSGKLTADFKFDFSHAEGPAQASHGILLNRDPVSGLVYGGSINDSPWKTIYNGGPNYLKGANSYTGEARINYDFGWATLTSITAYNHYNRLSIEDADGTPAPEVSNSYDFHSSQISQEVRLTGTAGGLRWTGGVYYLHQNSRGENTAPLFVQANGIPSLVIDANYGQKLNSIAGFVNAEYRFGDHFSIIGGARYTHDNKDFHELLRYFNTDTNFYNVWPQTPHNFNETSSIATFDFNQATAGPGALVDKGNVAAKVELDYKPRRGALLYASVTRGTKAGGFNNGYIDLGTPFSEVKYKGETLYSYEAGFKVDMFDKKLRINGAGFYYDYKNYQALTFINLGSAIHNRNATVYGAELEISAAPVQGLTLSMGGGLLHTNVKDVPSPTGVVADREMLLAPKWTLNGLARYETPVGVGKVALQGDFKATATYHSEILNSPALDIPGYVVGNFRVEYIAPGDRYRVAAFVRNVANTKYRIAAFDLTGSFGLIWQQFAPPRWFGGSLTVNFGK